jgi:hypothetical protein
VLRCALVAFAVAAGCASAAARADPAEELERLRAESAQMHRALDALDARIRALEGDVRGPRGAGVERADEPPARATRPDLSPVVVRRAWSQVERGVPAARVEDLLGKPEKLLRIDGNLVWYYVYPELGRGSVFFDASGKVSGAQPPGTGWSR